MKALKIVAIVLFAVVVLVALAAGLALFPSVQTWAVHKAVAGRPGLELKIDRVAAGLSAADLRNVRFVLDGVAVTADRVTVQYSAWDYIAHHRVSIGNLEVNGLVVDLRASAANSAGTTAPAGSNSARTTANAPATARRAGSSSSETPQPFKGLLNEARLPFDVRIGRFTIPGRALLPDQQTVTFALSGSDITTGQRGTIDWKVDLANAAPSAPIRSLHTTGTAGVKITTERRVEAADVSAVASAEGPNLPAEQLKLEAKAEQPVASGNEGYTVRLSLVRGANTEPLVTLAGQYDAAADEIAGAWNITARNGQIAAFLGGVGLPEVAMTGSGRITVTPGTGAIAANGELEGDVAHLEKISAQLGAIGGVRLQLKFDAAFASGAATLAQFTLQATTAHGAPLAQVDALQRVSFSIADQRVSFADAKADLAHIAVHHLPLAWVQPFLQAVAIDGGDVSVLLAVAAEADGSRVRITSVEPLSVRDMTLRQGETKLVERATLTAKPQGEYSADRLSAEIAGFHLATPGGDAVTGNASADVSDLSGARKIAFAADLQARITTALKPCFPVETGPLSVGLKTGGSFATNTVQLHHLSLEVKRAAGSLLAAAELRQPLTYRLTDGAITTPNADAETAHVRLGTVPLAWVQPFVANANLGGDLIGASLEIVVRGGGDVTVNTSEPLALRGVSATMNGQPVLQNVDVVADFRATKQDESVRYELRRIEVREGAAALATLTASGDVTLGKKFAATAKGTLDADLAALARQPIAASTAALAAGKLAVEFDGTCANSIQANATVALRGLVAKQNHQPLGEAVLQLTATVQPDGSGMVRVPFTMTNAGRKSDVLIDGRIARTNGGVSFDGRVASNQLFTDDLRTLAALAPGSAASPQPATPRPAAPPPTGPRPASPSTAPPDTQPFWTGVAGNLELDLKQITYGANYVISEVHGGASITAQQLALRSLAGKLQDNPFKVSATVAFDAEQRELPYTLTGAATVTNFNVGEFLRAANPNEPPQLETSVAIDAKLDGRGPTVAALTQNAYGTFQVTGSKGVLRALGRKGGQAVSVGSALLGVLGAARGSDTTVAVADLAGKLAVLPFDKFTMQAERGADLQFKIGRIEFVSPDTRVTGSGSIANQPGVPLPSQPMHITLQLAGKNEMALLLNKVGLLNGQQDDQGYYTMNTTFTLAGTPARPDAKDLWRIIAEAGVRAAAGRFLGGR